VDDDVRWLERDTFVSAKGGSSDQGCVSMLASKSAEAIHWLIDELGIPLSPLAAFLTCSPHVGSCRVGKFSVSPRGDCSKVSCRHWVATPRSGLTAARPDV